jgi:hypothetical protein
LKEDRDIYGRIEHDVKVKLGMIKGEDAETKEESGKKAKEATADE